MLLKLKCRGQSAIELIIVTGFFAFAFLIFLLILHQNTALERAANRNALLQDVALTVQQEISLAAQSISGYSRQFILPPKIAGAPYTITILDTTTLYIKTNDEKQALSLSVSNVTGQLILGTNLIKNVNNTVILNP